MITLLKSFRSDWSKSKWRLINLAIKLICFFEYWNEDVQFNWLFTLQHRLFCAVLIREKSPLSAPHINTMCYKLEWLDHINWRNKKKRANPDCCCLLVRISLQLYIVCLSQCMCIVHTTNWIMDILLQLQIFMIGCGIQNGRTIRTQREREKACVHHLNSNVYFVYIYMKWFWSSEHLYYFTHKHTKMDDI